MLTFTAKKNSGLKLEKTAMSVSDCLPIIGHEDNHILRTKDGDRMIVIALQGLAIDAYSEHTLTHFKDQCAHLYGTLSAQRMHWYCYTLNQPDQHYPAGSFPSGLSQSLNDAYQTQFEQQTHYRLQFMLVLVVPGPTASFKKKGWKKALVEKAHRATHANWANEAKKRLMDGASLIIHTLKDYRPTLLGVEQQPKGYYSQSLALFNYLLNLDTTPVPLFKIDYSHYLPRKRLLFHQQVIRWQGLNGQDSYGAILSIKQYSHQTYQGMMDGLMQLPFAFVMTQVFLACPKEKVQTRMQRQQAHLVGTADAAFSDQAAIDEAQDVAASNEAVFGEHALILLCLADSVNALNHHVSLAESALLAANLRPVREQPGLEAAFFAQFPGNTRFLARKAMIHNFNLASFHSAHTGYQGHRGGSHWGPPVTVLRSLLQTQVAMNWHVGKVGNTLIIGQTGSGKSLTANFLIAQSFKFSRPNQPLRLFYFDYKRGNETFVRALGGHYVRIGEQDQCLNPLQMPDTPQNRVDLQAWLELLMSNTATPLSVSDRQQAKLAIEANFANASAHRTLAEIEPVLATADNPAPLAAWYGEGSESRYFGEVTDTLSFDNPVVGMDMTLVLEDERALSAVTYALLIRINHVVRSHPGQPFIIAMDEGWALLRNRQFRQVIEQWLVTIRRAGGLVVFMTQNIDHLARYPELTQIIIANTPTKIFFPQREADQTTYGDICKLTEREIQLIRHTPVGSHAFLLKQDGQSCMVSVPLQSAALKALIPVLSGTDESVALLDAIRAEYGDDPNDWLIPFCQEVVA